MPDRKRLKTSGFAGALASAAHHTRQSPAPSAPPSQPQQPPPWQKPLPPPPPPPPPSSQLPLPQLPLPPPPLPPPPPPPPLPPLSSPPESETTQDTIDLSLFPEWLVHRHYQAQPGTQPTLDGYDTQTTDVGASLAPPNPPDEPSSQYSQEPDESMGVLIGGGGDDDCVLTAVKTAAGGWGWSATAAAAAADGVLRRNEDALMTALGSCAPTPAAAAAAAAHASGSRSGAGGAAEEPYRRVGAIIAAAAARTAGSNVCGTDKFFDATVAGSAVHPPTALSYDPLPPPPSSATVPPSVHYPATAAAAAPAAVGPEQQRRRHPVSATPASAPSDLPETTEPALTQHKPSKRALAPQPPRKASAQGMAAGPAATTAVDKSKVPLTSKSTPAAAVAAAEMFAGMVVFIAADVHDKRSKILTGVLKAHGAVVVKDSSNRKLTHVLSKDQHLVEEFDSNLTVVVSPVRAFGASRKPFVLKVES